MTSIGSISSSPQLAAIQNTASSPSATEAELATDSVEISAEAQEISDEANRIRERQPESLIGTQQESQITRTSGNGTGIPEGRPGPFDP